MKYKIIIPKSELANKLKQILDNMSQEEFNEEWKKITDLKLEGPSIIIPKEEPKQCKTPLDCGKVYNEELTTQTVTCSKCGNTHTFPFGGDYYCPSPKQETTLEEAQKQQFNYDNLHDAKEISSRIKVVETLEEAAERLLNLNELDSFRDYHYKQDLYNAFIIGIKYQQERSYSEEDMIAFGEFIFKHSLLTHTKGVKSLFEQFKKK
jgi:hypothetical protein